MRYLQPVLLAATLVGHIRRVVIDSVRVIVDMGRKRRLFTRLQLVKDAPAANGVEQKIRPRRRVENVGGHSDSARASASNCAVERDKINGSPSRRSASHSSMLISNSSAIGTTTGSIS